MKKRFTFFCLFFAVAIHSQESKELSIKQDNAQQVVVLQNSDAEPKNGFPAFYKDFANRYIPPVDDIRDLHPIEIILQLNFTIKANGKIVDVIDLNNNINKKIPSLLKEARRVLKKSPIWTPAFVDGKAVDSKHTMPFTIKI